MKRIGKLPFEKLSLIHNCTFGPLNEPVETVYPGEIVEVETLDCYADMVGPNQTLMDILQRGKRPFDNPITGPLYIEGAEPGDLLVVEILKISIPDEGVTTVAPGFGALEGWLESTPPITKVSKIKDARIVYQMSDSREVEIPTSPFVGTIGVSPEFEAISTTVPGRHGGNMDAPEVCPGNKLYIPIMVKGALLGLGDVHAVQGDGEICGTAIEIPSTVTMKIDLIKNKKIDWPRIESSDEIMTVCSAKPMEDAVRLAFLELIGWLEKDYSMQRHDAYMFLSLVTKVRLAQIVNPLFTVVAKVPKVFLSSIPEHCISN